MASNSQTKTKPIICLNKPSQNLRKEHYILGKDEWNPLSEYRYEYVPKKTENKLDPTINTFLRNSHFVLGDTPLNYMTSSQEQNESIPKKIIYDPKNKNENLKTKFQNSNFQFGNEENDYISDYKSKYIDKSKMSNLNNEYKELIKNKNKKTSIVTGEDLIDYNTETSSKYIKPNVNYSQILKEKNNLTINTKELQKDHIGLFGNNPLSYSTTNRALFTPKYENNRYNKNIINPNLQNSHIFLGRNDDEKNVYQSEFMSSFGKKPILSNSFDIEKLRNLRASHFQLGNDFSIDNMNTVNKKDFQDPKFCKNYLLYKQTNKIDPLKYQKSNWSISAGEENDYKSAYAKMMTPKPVSKMNNNILNKGRLQTFKSSIIIGSGDNKDNYLSEYKKHYNKGLIYNFDEDKKNKENINLITNFIKNSHVNFGDNKNDYITTNNKNYRYDSDSAKKGRGILDSALLGNLRCSHYEIGDKNAQMEQTSNRRDYKAYPEYKNENVAANVIKTSSSVKLGNIYQNRFKGESIYMSDYTEKQLPNDDFPTEFV